MTRADLAALLRSAQMHNLNKHITGILLQVDDSFIQYLEGPEDEVRALYAAIAGDRRHGEFVKLQEGPVAERVFPHWPMAFYEVAGPMLRQGPINGLIPRILASDPAAVGEGAEFEQVLHRFWSECAAALPR